MKDEIKKIKNENIPVGLKPHEERADDLLITDEGKKHELNLASHQKKHQCMANTVPSPWRGRWDGLRQDHAPQTNDM